MSHTATQATSQEKSTKNRLDQARMQSAANNAFHDQKVAPISQAKKSPLKQPQEVTSPAHAQSRAQDLKMQQRTSNKPSQQINTSQQSTQQEASTKQNLKQQQRVSQGQRRMNKVSLSSREKKQHYKYQKTLKKYENSSFILVYAVAIASDILDVLITALFFLFTVAAAPTFGLFAAPGLVIIPLLWIISLSCRIYISVFIWTRSNRLSRKIMRVSIIVILDAIPIISLIPFTTMTVFVLDRKMTKDADEAKKALKSLRK